MAHILALDDDPAILDLIKNALTKEGHLVTTCQRTAEVNIAHLNRFDLILLDVMMPETDGFAFCKKIRSLVDCPILFLTAKTREKDILLGLGIGGDDYIMKPFRVPELRARIEAHLRRESRERHHALSFVSGIRLDLSAKVMTISEKTVPLTKSEYEICEYLAGNSGQVFTKEQIFEAIFGFDKMSDSATIATHIRNIRAKLDQFHVSPIQTVWGIGYRWE